MSILNELNEKFEIAASFEASTEIEIEELLEFSSIKIPDEYLEVICEKTEIEIHLKDKKYIRIWGALECIEMNSAYLPSKYIGYWR